MSETFLKPASHLYVTTLETQIKDFPQKTQSKAEAVCCTGFTQGVKISLKNSNIISDPSKPTCASVEWVMTLRLNIWVSF